MFQLYCVKPKHLHLRIFTSLGIWRFLMTQLFLSASSRQLKLLALLHFCIFFFARLHLPRRSLRLPPEKKNFAEEKSEAENFWRKKFEKK